MLAASSEAKISKTYGKLKKPPREKRKREKRLRKTAKIQMENAKEKNLLIFGVKIASKEEKTKSKVNEAGNYTKPTMRKALFNKIKAGSKGGKPGQWSARKAQMLAKQYKAKGGGYKS